MGNIRYVLDANVFLEYIFGRRFQNTAKEIIADAIKGRCEIIIPCLALDEISEVLYGNVDDMDLIETHLQYLERLIYEEVIRVVVPAKNIRIKAIEVARSGNRKSGYPEFTDCLYHALAISTDSVFITNDKKHVAKCRDFGNIQLLSELTGDFEK